MKSKKQCRLECNTFTLITLLLLYLIYGTSTDEDTGSQNFFQGTAGFRPVFSSLRRVHTSLPLRREDLRADSWIRTRDFRISTRTTEITPPLNIIAIFFMKLELRYMCIS